MFKIPISKKSFVFATVDIEDKYRVENYPWCMDKRGRVYTHNLGKNVYLGRYLLGITDPNIEVDHINGNKLDNRRCNLRPVTHQQNLQNCDLRKDNTSGEKGVSWHKNAKKWESYIKANGKRIHLGLFNSKEDAVRAYQEAAEKYFGEFRRKK